MRETEVLLPRKGETLSARAPSAASHTSDEMAELATATECIIC